MAKIYTYVLTNEFDIQQGIINKNKTKKHYLVNGSQTSLQKV